MDEEQALWEVATALGSTFDADATRTRAHAAAALLALMPEGAPGPLDREWHEGLAQATIPATVTLLAGGALDDYLQTGDNLSGAAGAVAKLAPLAGRRRHPRSPRCCSRSSTPAVTAPPEFDRAGRRRGRSSVGQPAVQGMAGARSTRMP